ncbi:hypothetical protein DFH09DRAFT_1099942 [Mycena vulgaris]|nr:hypothetical protein DFH09DRAFT_1099942 [Mycena vulgaris]
MCIQCAPCAVLYPREDRKPEYSSTKKKEIQRGIKQWRAPNGYSGHVAKKNPWVPSALLLCLCICGNWTARAPHDVRIGQLGRHALGMGSDKGARVLCCVVRLPEILRGQLDLRSQITLARRPPGGSRVRSYAACIVGFGVSGVADGEFESRGRGMLSLPRRRHGSASRHPVATKICSLRANDTPFMNRGLGKSAAPAAALPRTDAAVAVLLPRSV